MPEPLDRQELLPSPQTTIRPPPLLSDELRKKSINRVDSTARQHR